MLQQVRRYTVRLDISPEVFQRLYSGQARDVVAIDTGGVKIRFPATPLRGFVTRDGIHGVFVVEVGAGNRLIAIERKQVG